MTLIKDIVEKYNGMTDEEKAEFDKEDYQNPDEVKGLVSKRDELLGQNKKLRDKIKEGSDIPEEKKKLLDILEKNSIIEVDDLESAITAKGGDDKLAQENARLKKSVSALTTKSTELESQAALLKKAREADQVGKIISKSLGKFSFVSEYSKGLIEKEFLGKAQAEKSEDGKLSVFDSKDGITPIADSIESWSKTDEAKNFLKAPGNSGGGSGGGNGGQGQSTDTGDEEPFGKSDFK